MFNVNWSEVPSPQVLSKVNFKHVSRTVAGAFDLCREAELYVIQATATTVTDRAEQERRLINVRIVGHLLNLSPSDSAATLITQSIMSAHDDGQGDEASARAEGIIELGKFFDEHLLRSFRKFEGRTLRPCRYPSRPSFDFNAEQLREMLVETPMNHQEAKILALQRDGYRCMLTGWMDEDYWDDVHSKTHCKPDGLLTFTECAHIFSDYTNTNVEDQDKLTYAANAWRIIDSFGLGSILEELEGADTHRLENVLTLNRNLHLRFNKLGLWLEAVPNELSCYEVISKNPMPVDRKRVTFASHATDPLISELIALPDPRYLHIHALCCKVAHLSGAFGLYNQLDEDSEAQPDADSDPPAFVRALCARLELKPQRKPPDGRRELAGAN